MKQLKKILILFILIILTNVVWSCLNINQVYASSTYDYTQLNESKYPGFKSLIQKLKNQYGQFEFQIYETGINWEDALNMEFQGHNHVPKNLVEKTNNRDGMWFCPICTVQKFDSGYNCASKEALAYMMDPRNSISIDSIFQFENLENSNATASGIAKAVKNTFLDNQSVIDTIVSVSNESNINAYYITSKIINEQGKNGSTLSLGQGYKGEYVGVYNLFNINATANGSEAIIRRGLKYAQDKGWTTPELSIKGGISFVREGYIGRKQNTLYFQKYNVVSESGNLFNHQYQQNIMAAEMEGRTLKKYYEQDGILSSAHTFIIPVFENMPETACSRPNTKKENNTYYESATVDVGKNQTLTVFSSTSSSKIEISRLNNGEKVKILSRASNQIDGIYWDLIVSEESGTYGYVARNSSSGTTYLALTGDTGTTGNGEQISVADLVFDAEFYADKYADLKSAFGNNATELKKHWLSTGISEGRQASPVFDAVYYVNHSNDLKAAFGRNYLAAYNHFITNGYNEPRESSSEYCGRDYKNNYDDLKNLNNAELMKHYLEVGRSENRQALGKALTGVEKVLFDYKYYADNNTDLKNAFGYNEKDLRTHWLEHGIAEGRQASPLFNASYYLNNNADLKKAFGTNKTSAYNHFITNGYKELRASSKEYYGKCYKENNADLKNMSALELMQHYVSYGRKEGRVANNSYDLTPIDIEGYLFDAKVYADLYPDLRNAYGYNEKQLKNHWLNYGKKEGRQASLIFNAKYYLNNYSDLKNAFKKDYVAAYNHFVTNGVFEGRKASEQFDVKYYVNNNVDLKSAFKTSYTLAVRHFSDCGISEGRPASSTFIVKTYRDNNADLKNAFKNNYRDYYIHYINYGASEHRKAY